MTFFTLSHCSCPTFFKIFPFCSRVDTFQEPKSIDQIRIRPNDDNQVLIPDFSSNENETESDDDLKPLRCIHGFSCSDRCARMDMKIVKLAFQVLEKNAEEENDEHEKERFNKRMTKMEHTLDTIASRLNELLQK